MRSGAVMGTPRLPNADSTPSMNLVFEATVPKRQDARRAFAKRVTEFISRCQRRPSAEWQNNARRLREACLLASCGHRPTLSSTLLFRQSLQKIVSPLPSPLPHLTSQTPTVISIRPPASSTWFLTSQLHCLRLSEHFILCSSLRHTHPIPLISQHVYRSYVCYCPSDHVVCSPDRIDLSREEAVFGTCNLLRRRRPL